MSITHDFSNFPERLHEFALHQMTWRGIVILEDQVLSVASNAKDLRERLHQEDKYGYWLWWLRFGVGLEALVKAVFLNHHICILTKRSIAEKAPGRCQELATPKAADVYRFVGSVNVTADSNGWLAGEFARLGIDHPFEISTGTLGQCRANLTCLTEAGKATSCECQQIDDALTVLADIRRNVDAHVFLKTQVGGSIQGDLPNVYLPSANLLLEIYNR